MKGLSRPSFWDLIFYLLAAGWFTIGMQARECGAKRECSEFCKSREAKYDDSRWDELKGCECSTAKLQTWVRQ